MFGIESPQKSKLNITQVKNVNATITAFSDTGATIIIKDNNVIPNKYEKWYKIEKEINNEWYDVKMLIKNYKFDYITYEVDKKSEVLFVIDWESLYGKLSTGNYRIVKIVGNEYIAIPFSIGITQTHN